DKRRERGDKPRAERSEQPRMERTERTDRTAERSEKRDRPHRDFKRKDDDMILEPAPERVKGFGNDVPSFLKKR
ncbi:MAG TPA: RNA helicase, partial [Hyphomonas sp.]|nr:RNA helicase [Hyphomonas sp.]